MKNVFVVPHSHWDRAWYLPFEVFRHRLVRFVDQVLEVLESDEEFKSFTLDGQTVVLDDYLEIRSENRERVARLVKAKRMEIGPWYTLPDLFLSSGESLIRNLEMGLSHGEEFGGAMRVGYVPDPFGHPAELPQVLAGFGIDTFIFMRGMPIELKDKEALHFTWKSVGGGEVLAIYQPGGYLDGAALGYPEPWGRNEGRRLDLELAKNRIRESLEAQEKLRPRSNAAQGNVPYLVANGCDHMPIQPELPQVLENLAEPSWSLRISSLTEYTGALKSAFKSKHKEGRDLPAYSGDLLGNGDHPILSSVWSTHIRLKILNRRSEKILTRYVEPLHYMLRDYGNSNAVFIKEMWKKLFKNQAHDDICGCSHDDVHKEDEARFQRILALSESLILEKLEAFSMAQGCGSESGQMKTRLFLFNPNPWDFAGQLRAKILIPNPKGEFAPATPASALVCRFPDGQESVVNVHKTTPMDIRNRFLETTWGRSYEVTFDGNLEALQFQMVTIEETGSPLVPIPKSGSVAQYGFDFQASSQGISLKVNEGDLHIKDFLSFEWEEDLGDTYSASIVEGTKVTSTIQSCEVLTCDTVRVGYSLEGRSGKGKFKYEMEVDFSVPSRGGLEISIRYGNHVENGRLRMVVKPGFSSEVGLSEGHFRIVSQGRTPLQKTDHAPRAYPGELLYDTRHQGEFVILEDQVKEKRMWLAGRGHAEWELLEEGMAVTLHRSVGMLSVGGGRLRGCQAGPSIPTPYAQVLGDHHHEFCLGIGTQSLHEATRLARSFSTPVYVTELPYLRYVKDSEQEIRSSSVIKFFDPRLVLTSCRMREDYLEVRFFNESGTAGDFEIHLPDFKVFQKTSLDGQTILGTMEPKDGLLKLRLNPSEIITLRCQ